MSITITPQSSNIYTREFQNSIVTSDYTSETAQANKIPCSNDDGIIDPSWFGLTCPFDFLSLKSQTFSNLDTDTEINVRDGRLIFINGLDSNIKITLTTPYDVADCTMIVNNDNSKEITWSDSITFGYAGSPVLRSTYATVLRFYTLDKGITWYGSNLSNAITDTIYGRANFTVSDTLNNKVLELTESEWPENSKNVAVFVNGHLIDELTDYDLDTVGRKITLHYASNTDVSNVTIITGTTKFDDDTGANQYFVAKRHDKELNGTVTMPIELTTEEYPTNTECISFYKNGILLSETYDYTLDGRSLTLKGDNTFNNEILSIVVGAYTGYNVMQTLRTQVEEFLEAPNVKSIVATAYDSYSFNTDDCLMYSLKLTGNTIFTISHTATADNFSNSGYTMYILLTKDSSVTQTLTPTWPNNIEWIGGEPTFNTKLYLELRSFDSCNTWIGRVLGSDVV